MLRPSDGLAAQCRQIDADELAGTLDDAPVRDDGVYVARSG
jgi:hypothetical protein